MKIDNKNDLTVTTMIVRPAEGKFYVSFFQFSFLQVKVLEQQLEQEHEERINFLRERHELEGKIMGLQVIMTAIISMKTMIFLSLF